MHRRDDALAPDRPVTESEPDRLDGPAPGRAPMTSWSAARSRLTRRNPAASAAGRRSADGSVGRDETGRHLRPADVDPDCRRVLPRAVANDNPPDVVQGQAVPRVSRRARQGEECRRCRARAPAGGPQRRTPRAVRRARPCSAAPRRRIRCAAGSGVTSAPVGLMIVWSVASTSPCWNGVETANRRLGARSQRAGAAGGSLVTNPTHVLLLGTDSAGRVPQGSPAHRLDHARAQDPDHNRSRTSRSRATSGSRSRATASTR